MTPIETIQLHLPAALLVVARIGGLMVLGPVFGSSSVPVRVRVFLGFLVGFAVYPLVAADTPLPVLDLWVLGPLIAMEAAVGLLIGYVASLPLIGMQTGGLMMGQQMGLGFARFYNPALDDESDVVGQLLFFLALAAFLVVGGHELMLRAVLESYQHVPVGAVAFGTSVVDLLTGLLLAMLELALRVAAPLLALIFVESIALGFIAKTVPQLNILSLGFPLRILVGFAMLAVGLVVIEDVMMDAIDDTIATLFAFIEGGA